MGGVEGVGFEVGGGEEGVGLGVVGDGGDFEEVGEEEDGCCGGGGTGGKGGEGCEDVGEGLLGWGVSGNLFSFHIFSVARRMRGERIHELCVYGRKIGTTYIEGLSSSTNLAFKSADEVPRRRFFILDTTRPVLFPGANYHVFGIGSHCVQ